MSWLHQIASPAKLEVLRILYTAEAPLRLRRIAELAEVSLRPVQLALRSLERDGFLKSHHEKNALLFEIKELPEPLKLFFDAINQEQRRSRLKLVEGDSKSLGPFQEDAFKMLQGRTK